MSRLKKDNTQESFFLDRRETFQGYRSQKCSGSYHRLESRESPFLSTIIYFISTECYIQIAGCGFDLLLSSYLSAMTVPFVGDIDAVFSLLEVISMHPSTIKITFSAYCFHIANQIN